MKKKNNKIILANARNNKKKNNYNVYIKFKIKKSMTEWYTLIHLNNQILIIMKKKK